jgi:arabinofuranan 3-O-arabinosyltransferase
LAATAALLALLAYLPALTAAPGRMPSDSKLYLYLDPGRFLGDAASTFDPRQFAGWVPHQHVAYLWPSGPWFWFFETIGVPDWIAHRLWIGSLMLAAGLGVRWCARLLGLGATAVATAAVVYQVSVYVLPYVSRTSVMLLPWAGLGWVVAFTVRASRRRTWGDPAAIALIVLTVGAVNATALAMIVPGPVLWLVHEAWRRTLPWRAALLTAVRIASLSLAVSLWWIVMLVVQGRHGTDVLPYSESLADVSFTATSPEVWRGLGYWLFYVRDPYAATTTESLRYLSSSPAIAVSYLVPIVCLVGLVFVRWVHRRFAALLVVTGIVLSVGVHPIGDRSPLMRLVAGSDESGLALALRSSTRALPLVMLGLSLAAGAVVVAATAVPVARPSWHGGHLMAPLIGVLAVLNLPALWTGAFVDPALERDQSPPRAWIDAASAIDAARVDGRVLQLPGQEFGAYRWGYTVDQPLPGITEQPLVTRDLLPLGSAGAMDLLYALDDRIQDGTLEPESLAPVARLLGVDTVWVTNDSAFDRFGTARPEVVADLTARAPGLETGVGFGQPFVNRPDVAVTDERAVGDPRVGSPQVPVVLHRLETPGTVVRTADRSVIVSGSGGGLVDAAAAGLIDGRSLVRYSASIDASELPAAIEDAAAVIVTDSNRDRARHWRSSQDTTGYTEPGGADQDVLRPVVSDERLPVFDTTDPDTQTVALQRGPITATATAYGEPFAYLPEHRPFMAVDGDPETAWIVGEHSDPVGETLRLDLEAGAAIDSLTLRQPAGDGVRRITRVEIATTVAGVTEVGTISLDDRSVADPGQPIVLPPDTTRIEITIVAVGGGEPGTAGAVAGVGFAEVAAVASNEFVRPPHDALARIDPATPVALVFNRLRTDPMDRWRDDPEPTLVRAFELPVDRIVEIDATVRIDARASDEVLAELFDWPVAASTRLTGSLRNPGAAAFDGHPETAWITAFDGASGATLIVRDVELPVDRITVRQPIAGFTRVTSVTVAGDGEARTVALTPDAGGTATSAIDPPLPPGTISISVAAIEPVTTIDRRHADVVELPAAINEISFPGAPHVDLAPTISRECTSLASLGGASLDLAISIEGEGWLDGEPVDATVCTPPLELGAGGHVLMAHDVAATTLDRVTLFGGWTGITEAGPWPSVAVIERSRRARTVDVRGCADGCWLVLGEGHSAAWNATSEGRSLGEPELVDGGFNGWWLDGSDTPIRVELRWTAQRPLTVALILSLLAAVVAAALIVLDRRARRDEQRPVPTTLARLDVLDGRRPSGGAITHAVAWIVTPAVLIGPSWAVWGAVGAIAVVTTGRRRLAELTALAGVGVIGAGVTFLERRDMPAPGGAWPATFESLHGLGMFAAGCLLVGAITADDASDGQSADDS